MLRALFVSPKILDEAPKVPDLPFPNTAMVKICCQVLGDALVFPLNANDLHTKDQTKTPAPRLLITISVMRISVFIKDAADAPPLEGQELLRRATLCR